MLVHLLPLAQVVVGQLTQQKGMHNHASAVQQSRQSPITDTPMIESGRGIGQDHAGRPQ